MATATKLLFVINLICFFPEGNGQKCELSALKINVTNTGARFGYDFVFEVEVKNTCSCVITNVYLHCSGFISSMPVDPKAFRLKNDAYLINDGKAIPRSQSFKFQYSWDRAFWPMIPARFHVAC